MSGPDGHPARTGAREPREPDQVVLQVLPGQGPPELRGHRQRQEPVHRLGAGGEEFREDSVPHHPLDKGRAQEAPVSVAGEQDFVVKTDPAKLQLPGAAREIAQV